MIKAIIVDDELSNIELLSNLLQKHCPQVTIVGEADSVEMALKKIEEHKPNLVFLDIQMPTGNGFQLFEKFNPIPFDTIFVTSFDQYAINAIKFSALDYLLKPIDIDELKVAVNKALIKAEKENNVQLLYQNLLNNIKPETTDKKIVVHSNNKAILLQLSQIAYIEADSNYSFIHMIKGDKHHTAKTLKEIEEFTENTPHIIRVNRSIIINTNYCSHYQKGEPYIVVLKNKLSFEISRRKRSEVLEKLKLLLVTETK